MSLGMCNSGDFRCPALRREAADDIERSIAHGLAFHLKQVFKFVQIMDQSVTIASAEDKAVLAFHDQVFGAATLLRDQHRKAGRHGLIHNQSPRFATAWKNKTTSKGVVR